MSKPENLKLDERISYLETFKTKVLWENQTPSVNMAGDVEINFISDDYDEIRWFFIFSTAEANLNNNQSFSCLKGKSVTLYSIGYASNSTVRRTISYLSDTKYKTQVAKHDSEENNSYCIPVMAIGIKYYKGDEGESVDVLEQTLDEYLQVFNTSIQTKKQELEEIINEAKSEINSTTNKYARALPDTVQDQSFAQIYADSPIVDKLEIKGNCKNIFTTSFSQNGPTRIKSGRIEVKENMQYIFGAKSTLGHALQFAVNYFTTENNLISSSAYFGNKRSFTTPANTRKIEIQIRDFENSGVNNNINVEEVIEPQLELGSVLGEYREPVDNLKLDITGKNYIGYKENGTITNYGLTINYLDGIFTINGTVVEDRDVYLNLAEILTLNSFAEQKEQEFKKLYKNKYILSYKYLSGTKSSNNTNLSIANKVSGATISFALNKCDLEDKSIVVNLEDNTDCTMYFWFPKSTTFTDFKFALQLEVGETVTEIEPYKNKKYTITLPENKFLDVDSCIKKVNNKWYLVGTETVELSEAAQTVLNSIELYEDINNISIEGGTISFKYNKSLTRVVEEIYSLIGANISHESGVLDNG